MEKVLLIVILITLIAGIALIIHVNKIRKNKFIEVLIDQIKLENINLTDCFSKDVVSFYLSVLKDTNKYSLNNCTLNRVNDDVMIWASNDIHNRRFYTHNEKKKKEVEDMNSKLTHYDKVLMDKVINSFKNRQDKLVTKFFL
tara:strand:+ start:417 stop:842 length:426 start_codon:yes stop_codon:yes gene_type:complete